MVVVVILELINMTLNWRLFGDLILFFLAM